MAKPLLMKHRCASETNPLSVVSLTSIVLILTLSLHEAGAENGNGNHWPYVEVYPPTDTTQDQFSCVPSENRTCPLYVAVTMSFGGEYLSSGVIGSIQYALDQINNNDSSLLPGYTLHYTLTDSQCNRTVSLGALHTQIINPPTKIAVIGSGCSIATEASAEISHFFNITQLSCVSSSAELAKQHLFPNYFQLLAPDDDLADAFLAIIQKFGWRRVAIITQRENLLTVTMDKLKKSLENSNITFTEKRFDTAKGVESLGDNPFDPEARIFVVAMYYVRAQHLMCKAYEHRKRYPQYLFLFYGWYIDKWWIGTEEDQKYLYKLYPHCTSEHIASVLPYSLAPLRAEFLRDQNESTIIRSGINGTQFRMQYARYLSMSRFNLTEDVYSQQCYDATWALAYALNDTLTDIKMECSTEETAANCSAGLASSTPFGLQHFHYNNSNLLQKIKGHLEASDFRGITGKITFNHSDEVHRKGKTVVLSYQPCDKEICRGINITRIGITKRFDNGTVEFSFTTKRSIWGAAGRPYDGVPHNSTVTIHLPVAITLIGLGVLGIVFAAACLCFNFAFRNKPLVRLTSPNLNYLIGIGAIILYIDICLSVVPTTDLKVLVVLCSLTPWLIAIGYSLCFGTILAKMWRVYYIFNNPTPTKKVVIHDWILALIVLLLVGIDIFILTIYTAVEGARGRLSPTRVQDRENFEIIEGELMRISRFYIIVCRSTSRDIALGILYGYKGLLQIAAILFAFSIRKVKVKGLDDAKYIVAAVYVTSIVTAIIIVATYTLFDYRNALSVVLSIGILVGATVILILVFVPKMVALRKDPEGTTIFTKQQPASSSHSHSHPKRMSLSGTKGTTDHSTIGEAESLRKRVSELECEIAAKKEVKGSCDSGLGDQTTKTDTT